MPFFFFSIARKKDRNKIHLKLIKKKTYFLRDKLKKKKKQQTKGIERFFDFKQDK